MNISYIGTNKKITNLQFTGMIHFFCGLLMPESIIDKLSLEISFDLADGIPGWSASTHQGDTIYDYCIWIRPTKSVNYQVETLAHEIVHVKQFSCGELCANTGKIMVPALKSLGGNSPHYYDNPSEIEAFGRSVGLVERYTTHLKNNS